MPTHRAGTLRETKAAAVKLVESNYLSWAMEASSGNITHAAKLAGKHPRAFWALLQKQGMLPRRKAHSARSILPV